MIPTGSTQRETHYQGLSLQLHCPKPLTGPGHLRSSLHLHRTQSWARLSPRQSRLVGGTTDKPSGEGANKMQKNVQEWSRATISAYK